MFSLINFVKFVKVQMNYETLLGPRMTHSFSYLRSSGERLQK